MGSEKIRVSKTKTFQRKEIDMLETFVTWAAVASLLRFTLDLRKTGLKRLIGGLPAAWVQTGLFVLCLWGIGRVN